MDQSTARVRKQIATEPFPQRGWCRRVQPQRFAGASALAISMVLALAPASHAAPPPIGKDIPNPISAISSADLAILSDYKTEKALRDLQGSCPDRSQLQQTIASSQAAYKGLSDAKQYVLGLHDFHVNLTYSNGLRQDLPSNEYGNFQSNLEKLIDQRMLVINDFTGHLERHLAPCEAKPNTGTTAANAPVQQPHVHAALLRKFILQPINEINVSQVSFGLTPHGAMMDAEDALDDASDALDDIYDFEYDDYDDCLDPDYAQELIDHLNEAYDELQQAQHPTDQSRNAAYFGLNSNPSASEVNQGLQSEAADMADEAFEITLAIDAIRRHTCHCWTYFGPVTDYDPNRIHLIVGAEFGYGPLTTTYDDNYRLKGDPFLFGLNVGVQFPVTPSLSVGPTASLFFSGDNLKKENSWVSLPLTGTFEGTVNWQTPIMLPNGGHLNTSLGFGVAVSQFTSGYSDWNYSYKDTENMVGYTASLKFSLPVSDRLSLTAGLRYLDFGKTKFNSPYGDYKLREDGFIGTAGLTYSFGLK